MAAAAILSDAKSRPDLRAQRLQAADCLCSGSGCYAEITRKAVAWAVVCVEPGECDRLGMHVANVAALRRALCRLDVAPSYVLTDGFCVDGLGVPGLAIWKGDRVAACVAAASILAKVTRDRIMCELDERYPEYEFADAQGILHPAAPGAAGPVRPVGHPPDALRELSERLSGHDA